MSSSAQASISKPPQNAKMAAPKNVPSADTKAGKTHRRSRSGCFTCRLRRKKCEESKPACKACSHLGLRCDYKRPMWWSNGEQRRHQKEAIKNVIKKTQLSKKSPPSQQHPAQPGVQTPPALSHSVPTSADVFSDSYPHSRAPSVCSPFSAGWDPTYASPEGYFAMPPAAPSVASHPPYPMFSPYEVDIKTERHVFINGEQTRKDSTMSTFSTFQPPGGAGETPSLPSDSWVQRDYFESTSETFSEEPVGFNFFELPHGQQTPGHEAIINVDDCDKYLLNHFIDKVQKLIFPILEANQHGSARSDLILPALESNKAYLHCCLSIAAMHMKSTEGLTDEQIDNDIVRHRYTAVSELCQALNQDANHSQILEATLGMIFFQCSVGRPDDTLPDIPWHQHFQAVISLVEKLDLPHIVEHLAASGHSHPPFNMALTAWIDILGATMCGRPPAFADTYRELNTSRRATGLAELMGCDDNVMFLISEIACLDTSQDQLSEVMLCTYVETLANEIGATEPPPGSVQNCFATTGALRPKQLSVNITAVFRVAARIYLCSLVPGYEPRQPSMCHLVSQFSELMNYIPDGPEGFDRSLAWPLLIAGASSVECSPFRSMFAERCQRLGEAANFGSFGRIRELLKDVWQINDANARRGVYQGVRWRDAMPQKGWDCLLI